MDNESLKSKLLLDQITINQKKIDELNKLKPSGLSFVYIWSAYALISIAFMFIETDIQRIISLICLPLTLIIYALNKNTNRRIDLLIEIIKDESKNT